MSDLTYDPIRNPTFQVIGNASPIAGAISCTVTSNNYYHCDTFSIDFAASASDAGWWDVDPPLVLDIQAAVTDGSFGSLIIGEVDKITLSIDAGVVSMEGRDLSARLIETKTQEAFTNKTASEVASILAQRHGLSANVTQTSTLVGRYYAQDHSRVTLDQFSKTQTEWDLLTALAQFEDFDLYMTGTTLNFVPRSDGSSEPFVVNWIPPSPIPQLNAINMRLERSLTLAKDVQVQVRSWNSKQKKSFTKTAKAVGAKSPTASRAPGGKSVDTQNYVIVKANLTEDQAQKLANKTLAEITAHERSVSVEMPGELDLTPRDMVAVRGTSTSFDQTYYVDTIERSLSFEDGFRQSLRLKNSSPRNQVLI